MIRGRGPTLFRCSRPASRPRRRLAFAAAVAAVAVAAPGAVRAAVEESDGRLDRTFSDGIVRTAFAGPGQEARDVANAVIVRSDGRVLVGGRVSDGDDQFALVRYRRNGELDRDFAAPAGLRTIDASAKDGGGDSIADLAIQPDGGIVVAGYATPGEGGHDFALARFDSEGDLDPSFGVGGVALTPAGAGNAVADDEAAALAVQPDGRIVVAGSTSGAGGQDAALARFGSNGTLDPTFSGDGLLQPSLSPAGEDRFVDVEVGAAGAITAVGSVSHPNDPGRPDIAVARFRPDGSADPTLGGTGVVELDLFGAAEVPTSLALRPGGGILVAGTTSGPGFCDALAVVSLTAGGALDTGFGKGGIAYADLNGECGEEANAIALQPNGKVLVGGGNGRGEFALVRLTAAGGLDPAMGGDGVVVRPVDAAGLQPASRGSAITDLAVGRAGSVVVVGSSRPGADVTAWTVARFTNPCALAAANLRGVATRFGKAVGRLKKAGPRLKEARRRAANRAKARMKRALRTAKRACKV